MGTISAWSGFSGNTANAEELADVLYHTSTVPAFTEAFSVLHGRLDSANWTGVKIPTWAVQDATFFAGFYHGWERWDFVYARQQSSIAGEELYAIHAGLTRRFFLPWDARVILYGYQLFARQDAAIWDLAEVDHREYWQLDLSIDDVTKTEARVLLPHGRESNSGLGPADSPATDEAATNPENTAEDRWRYCSPCGALMPATDSTSPIKTKGYHRLEVKVSGTIQPPDQYQQKLTAPTGALWMFAIRG
jgi:hypothetical protein